MNYIQLINAFWAKAESDNLKGNDISVYFSLVKYCNKLNWLNPFVCHWDIVCQYAKVSKNSYYKSVETLSSKGYIKYEKGKKNQLKPKIVILQLENKEGIIKEQNGEQHEEQNGEQKGNLYKLLNNKTIKLINKNASLVNSNLEKWIDSESKDKEKKVFHSDVFDCYESCIEFFDESLIPDTESKKNSWLDTIEKLNRLDNLKFEDILVLVKKTREDDFWSGNFLSIPKLRKKNKEGIIYWKVFYNQFKKNNHAALTKAEQRDIDLANW